MKTVQCYVPGRVYNIINATTVVFDRLGNPHLGPSQEEFLGGYMLSSVFADPFPPNMLCLQTSDKYVQFLWNEKTIWLFILDANACLRPLISGYNQTE